MFLRDKKSEVAEGDRNVLNETARIGTTPGQKMLGLFTAVAGSALILGAIGYTYVWPAWKGEKDKQPGDKKPAVARATDTPTLNVPLDLKPASPAPIATNAVFEAGPADKPFPPGLIAPSQPAGVYPTQFNPNPVVDQRAIDLKEARKRKMDGDLGSLGVASAQAPAAPAPAPGSPNGGPLLLQANAGGSGGGNTGIAGLLVPTSTPATAAAYIPNQGMTLVKGTSITCTLDTAIQTDQPGFTSCLTDYPIYSMNGKVVLLERGTKIEGEYSRGIERGMKAVFVLWSRAVTPTGVVVSLASPGTDQLGRAGVHGEVDTKFWDRFGGALLFSLLQDSMTIAAARAAQNGDGNNVVVLPSTQSTGTTAASEILKQGSDIKPSLYKNQGESVAITVARDVDFSTVYNLSMNRPK